MIIKISKNQKLVQHLVLAALLTLSLLAILPFSAQAISAEDRKRCEDLKKSLQAVGPDGKPIADLSEDLPQFCTVNEVYVRVIDIVLGLAASVAVVFIVIGGFWYLTSAGNEEQAEKGRKALLNAIIGLVVIILSFAIVRIVSNLLTSGAASPTPPSGFVNRSGFADNIRMIRMSADS